MTDIKRTIMDSTSATSSEAMKRIARVCGALRINDIKTASDEQRELILEHGIANTLPPATPSLDVIPKTEEQWQTCLVDVRDRAKTSLRDYCVRIYQYKESCEPSTFCKTVVELLDISESQAIKMALVGADEHIRTANVEDLPSSLETLYLTTTLTDEKKHEAFDSGAINSKTTRADVQQMKRPKPVELPTVIPAQVEDAVIIPPDDPEAVEVSLEDELAEEDAAIEQEDANDLLRQYLDDAAFEVYSVISLLSSNEAAYGDKGVIYKNDPRYEGLYAFFDAYMRQDGAIDIATGKKRQVLKNTEPPRYWPSRRNEKPTY